MKNVLRGLLAALLFVASALVAIGSAAPASAAVDIYITPGTHYVNGRVWKTTCGPYSSTIDRCRTDIKSGKAFVFNNLTYRAAPRAAWGGNPLGMTSQWSQSGRMWRTECDTALTGYNGCRSFIMDARGTWVFNNMVRFSNDFYLKSWGFGDTVITLPAGVTSGTVSSSYDGDGYFALWTLNGSNGEEELLANEIGRYAGTGAFGHDGYSNAARKIQVEADGPWSLVVKPLSTAPKFSGSISGQQDSVLWYTGPAANVRLTHSGDGYFGVWAAYADGNSDLLANEVGHYSGTRAVRRGPALITIDADGAWSLARVS